MITEFCRSFDLLKYVSQFFFLINSCLPKFICLDNHCVPGVTTLAKYRVAEPLSLNS
jgi:hypothetical protein